MNSQAINQFTANKCIYIDNYWTGKKDIIFLKSYYTYILKYKSTEHAFSGCNISSPVCNRFCRRQAS